MRALLSILAIAVAACSQTQGEPKAQKPIEVLGDFRTKTYPISESEHVLVMDLPSRILPERCWVYVNERIGTSHMHCADDGTATSEPPARGPELER